MMKIAIIGAGLSGALLYHFLKMTADVTVFEKSRGAGGRMSTRYADPYFFNHGTPFFDATLPEFQNFLKLFTDKKIIEYADLKKAVFLENSNHVLLEENSYYRAIPHMNNFCKSLIDTEKLFKQSEISRIYQGQDGWTLEDKEMMVYTGFDHIISTAPLPQTQNLLGNYLYVPKGSYEPCHVLMLGLSMAWDEEWDYAQFENSFIDRVITSREGTKINLVIHTKSEWSIQHLEVDKEKLIENILNEFNSFKSILQYIEYQSIHRWLYSRCNNEAIVIYNRDKNLSFVADGSGGIESAWLNVQELLSQLI